MYFTYFGYDITFLPDVQALNLNFHIASCQANDEPQLIRYILRHLTLSPQSITATMIPILYLLTDSQSTQALTSVVQRDVVHPIKDSPGTDQPEMWGVKNIWANQPSLAGILELENQQTIANQLGKRQLRAHMEESGLQNSEAYVQVKVMSWKTLGKYREMIKKAGEGSRPAERCRGKQ